MGTIHRLGGGPNLPGTADVIALLETAKRQAMEKKAQKCIVLLIDDENLGEDKFWFWHDRVGMKNSEVVAHLEIMKHDIMKKMDET